MCRRSIFFPLLSLLVGMSNVHAQSRGGEIAVHTVPQLTGNVTYRQNLCGRYLQFLEGEFELKDALSGLQLNTVMANYKGAYFNYDPNTGIDWEYPGLQAVIMDELANRGKFTWRDSFGVFMEPNNATWTELLIWSADTYDVSVDWWSRSLERLSMGVSFTRPWYDSGTILVEREVDEGEETEEVIWFNWLRPYTTSVWLTTLATILLSAVVYQWLELLAGDSGDRDTWEWFQQNLYLSAINFTQAYEYKPKSLAGRIFGVSMAVWALVMTATYTANLASLLVERQKEKPTISTLAEAAVFGKSVCSVNGYVSDTHIRNEYPDLKRISYETEVDMYAGLRRGDCNFATDTVAGWESHKGNIDFNPTCDISWVGGDRKVIDSAAGFAAKAASGGLCTSLVRDVLDYHMESMIADGFLARAWDQENRRQTEIDCLVYRAPEEENGGRRLDARESRHLNSNTEGAASTSSSEEEGSKLKMSQMLGTFICHWLMMSFAVGIAFLNHLNEGHLHQYNEKKKQRIDNSRRLDAARNTTGVSPGTPAAVENSHDSNGPASRNVGVPNRTADTSSDSASGGECKRLDSSDGCDVSAIRKQMAEMQKGQQEMQEMQRQSILALWNMKDQFFQQYGIPTVWDQALSKNRHFPISKSKKKTSK